MAIVQMSIKITHFYSDGYFEIWHVLNFVPTHKVCMTNSSCYRPWCYSALCTYTHGMDGQYVLLQAMVLFGTLYLHTRYGWPIRPVTGHGAIRHSGPQLCTYTQGLYDQFVLLQAMVLFGTQAPQLCTYTQGLYDQFILLQAMVLFGTQVLNFVPTHKVCMANSSCYRPWCYSALRSLLL